MTRRLRSSRRAAEGPDSLWPPLADTMTLAACVFFIIFSILLFGYAQTEIKRAHEKKAEFETLTDLSKQLKIQQRQSEEVGKKLAELEASGVHTRETNGVWRLVLDEDLLFERGHADIRANGKTFLKERLVKTIQDILQTKDREVLIAGHTDARPIATKEFPSNWELSMRRASNVLRTILGDMPDPALQGRVYAAGFANTRPLPGLEGEDSRHRRVEIYVVPILSNNLKVPVNGG